MVKKYFIFAPYLSLSMKKLKKPERNMATEMLRKKLIYMRQKCLGIFSTQLGKKIY